MVVQAARTAASTVSGNVTLDGEPVEGVTVIVTNADATTSREVRHIARAVTDSAGRYRLAGLPAGRYRVQAAAPGLISEEQAAMTFSMGHVLNLNASEAIENMDFKLTSGGVITGRVTLANGTPLIGMQVRLYQVDQHNRRQNFMTSGAMAMVPMTDDRGVYRLFGLPAGRYVVGVNMETMTGAKVKNGFLPSFHPDLTELNEAKVIEVTTGSEATDIDIRVKQDARPSYAVTLRVVDAQSGEPLPGVTLDYGPRQGNAPWFIPANVRQLSNARGEARMENLPPGRYGAGVARYRNDGQLVELYSEPVPFEIKEGDVEGIEIRAERGIPLTGIALIEGNANPALLAQLGSMRFNAVSHPQPERILSSTEQQFTINRDGTFRIAGLRPGKVSITPLMQLGARQWKGLSLLRVEANGVASNQGFLLSAEAPPKNLRLVFAYGTATIRGVVNVVNGAVPTGARTTVTAHRTDSPGLISNGLHAEVDARGQFALEGVAAGEYEVKVSSFWQTPIAATNEKSEGRGAPPPMFRNYSATQIVRVPASGEVSVTLTLDLNPKIPGRN